MQKALYNLRSHIDSETVWLPVFGSGDGLGRLGVFLIP